MTAPYYEDETVRVFHGDCLDVLRSLPDNSVDSVVTDPPYGLSKEPDAAEVLRHWLAGDDYIHQGAGFMGKTWDSFVPGPSMWRECFRVLRPGGHLLSFAGSRTHDLMSMSIRLAGFEIRDNIARLHAVDINDIDRLMEAWQQWTERVPSAGLRFRELDESSAAAHVLLEPSHSESPARALIAELASSAARHTPEVSSPSAPSPADATTTGLSALVTIAGHRHASPAVTCSTVSTAPADVPAWLDASREATTRAAEALRIWLGAGQSSKPEATDALCAALSSALKHITCAHSETFRSYDTTWQTVCASATTATTTASTAASLLVFMADTLAALDPKVVMPLEAGSGLAWVYGSGFPRLKSLDVSKAIDKMRDDKADILAVTTWLSARRTDAGMSIADINRAMNLDQMARWWFTDRRDLCQCPTWEQWQQLRDLLSFGDEMDAEVWRLNGRKGTPGEAFQSREVLSSREVLDIRNGHGRATGGAMFAGESTGKIEHKTTAPATPAAQQWQGWGTALKPAFEPIVVARKPLGGNTVAANVLAHGTGALNIDGTRVGAGGQLKWASPRGAGTWEGGVFVDHGASEATAATQGRWPANVLLDGSQADALDEQSGILKAPRSNGSKTSEGMNGTGTFRIHEREQKPGRADDGGASRFFPTFRYQAKAPTRERVKVDGVSHPTVKPLELMRWLVRLVTPPGGVVLEPFAGSGTTVEAAMLEGFRCVAIEREADYLPLILERIRRSATSTLTPQDAAAAEALALFDFEEPA